jgi:hypothetical protein
VARACRPYLCNSRERARGKESGSELHALQSFAPYADGEAFFRTHFPAARKAACYNDSVHFAQLILFTKLNADH